MLTAKQREVLLFVERRLEETGISPSFEEIKNAVGLQSKSGVHRLITALEERGYVRRLRNRARALDVLRSSNGTALSARSPDLAHQVANDVGCVPLLGRIAAGLPIEAVPDCEMLALPGGFAGSRVDYALEVVGDSMIEAGILDGDYVLIERTSVAPDGETVVALVRQNEVTLKRLRRHGDRVLLESANFEYACMDYPASDVTIQGRLAGLIRRYH